MKDILFIVGSDSDREVMEPGLQLADEKKLSYEYHVISAHRKLPELLQFLGKEEDNFKVIVTAAGLSAALPGVVAASVKKPVIGIPVICGPLNGIDALLSIIQLPKGTPVATMGLGKQGVLNAIHLAERIINLTR
jgi:5-(carboxyamino)imidazole ribonucleotide mutase